MATLVPRETETTGPPKPRQADPCVMVIFGAAGDLTKRKLLPALHNLASRRSAAGALRGRRRSRAPTCPRRNSASKMIADVRELNVARPSRRTSWSG